jgi:hypothetical protein
MHMTINRWLFPALTLSVATVAAPDLSGKAVAAAGALSARAIMEKVAITRKLDGSEAVIKMTLIDAKGAKRAREPPSSSTGARRRSGSSASWLPPR